MPCEGYLGIEPYFELLKYFAVSLYVRREKKSKATFLVPMGCVSIRLRQSCSQEYMAIPLSTSNKGWHSDWFYVKNNPTALLPAFMGCHILEVPARWDYGPVDREYRSLVKSGVFTAIQTLKDRGLRGAVVIGGYHVCCMAPLMARTLLLYMMTLNAPTAGTVISDDPAITGRALSFDEVEDYLREAVLLPKDVDTQLVSVYPIPGDP